MKNIPKSLKEIYPEHKGNEHIDIFGAKSSNCPVIRNPQIVHQSNVFQERSDAAYVKYQESVKRPASSHRNPKTFRDDQYTFDSEWCNPKFQHGKTLVNQNAYFPQDYHHQRRLDELTSSIFVSEEQKQRLRNIYTKNSEQPTEQTRNPNHNTAFGRRSTIAKQYDNDNAQMRKVMPNYSNLFGLNDRNSKSTQQLPNNVQPLIPNKMKWEQFDSVLQRGSKDEEVNGEFHKKRYYENMKSSMDTHNGYDNYMPQKEDSGKKNAPYNPIVMEDNKGITQPVCPPQTIVYSENSQKFANEPAKTPVLKQKQRPQSSMKKPTSEITIVKGLSSKFSLPALAQQCKLHSLLLAKFNNEMHEGNNTGRGVISVVPQKKYGLENLCSWLRSQGLTIRIR